MATNPYCDCGHMKRNHSRDGVGQCVQPGCDCKLFTNLQERQEQEALAGLEPPEPDSNLYRHAKAELARLGDDNDQIHPEFSNKILEIVAIFASMGHSGSSAHYTKGVIQKVLSFEALSPITDDPSEWQKHEPDMWDGKNAVWQNRRDSRLFSLDGGVTFWNIDQVKKGDIVTTKRSEETVHGPNGAYVREQLRARDLARANFNAPYDN